LVRRAGAEIEVSPSTDDGGEPSADVTVRGSNLSEIRIDPDEVPGVIDEVPVLAVLGVSGGGRFSIRGASELRHKESDRLRALAVNLAAIGAKVEEFDDGLEAVSDGPLRGGTVSSFGDHRIAMAFAVAGLASREGVRVEDADSVDISFPGFFDRLADVVER
jgi:3-phosphoshikimate 1-carboxyvinyltransferase